MNAVWAVAAGGALGASIRFGVNQAVINWFHAPLILATLTANIVGCFLMGLSYKYFNQVVVDDAIRMFVTVGFLGALTTWSTFSMETVLMIQNDEVIKALGYTLVTTVCCFMAFWLGVKS